MSAVLPIPSLHPSEFLHAVLHLASPSAIKIAVFDCDGTLWSGDAGSEFMKWTIESGLVSREVVDFIDSRYRAYLRGDVSELAICGEMVQMYQGLHEDEMRRVARVFFAEFVRPCIFPEMRSLIEQLHQLGTEIWAVSSTNHWVIEEGVREFGIPADHVLAARVRIADGLVTNQILAVPTGDGKVTALHQAGVHAPNVVFGNSVHDAAMLAIAARPFAVNPSPALALHARQAGWPIFLPESVRSSLHEG